MKPLVTVGAAVIIAVAGTWAKKKQVEPKQIIGGMITLIFFALLTDVQPEIAEPLGWIVLSTIIGSYGTDLFGTIAEVTTASGGGAGKAMSATV